MRLHPCTLRASTLESILHHDMFLADYLLLHILQVDYMAIQVKDVLEEIQNASGAVLPGQSVAAALQKLINRLQKTWPGAAENCLAEVEEALRWNLERVISLAAAEETAKGNAVGRLPAFVK